MVAAPPPPDHHAEKQRTTNDTDDTDVSTAYAGTNSEQAGAFLSRKHKPTVILKALVEPPLSTTTTAVSRCLLSKYSLSALLTTPNQAFVSLGLHSWRRGHGGRSTLYRRAIRFT